MAKYDDKMINDFLELAQEVGYTRAMRELGYPNSWDTAQRWAKNRGVTVAVDELKARANAAKEWYEEQEVKMVIQEGFNRVHDELAHNPALTPDDQKKLSDAANKYYQMWANINNKASSITETRTNDALDAHLSTLLFAQNPSEVKGKEEEPEKKTELFDVS